MERGFGIREEVCQLSLVTGVADVTMYFKEYRKRVLGQKASKELTFDFQS